MTLTAEEKSKLLRMTRQIATQVGRPGITVTMGCTGQCTRDVIVETRLAKEAGADYALVLVPSYFHFAMNQDAIVAFFEEVRSAVDLGLGIADFPQSSLMLAPFRSSSTTSPALWQGSM